MTSSMYHDGWYESPTNYDDFCKKWSNGGLVIPFIAEPLRSGLLTESHRGLFWSTSREVDIKDLYQLDFMGRGFASPQTYLQSGREDFFMTALPGGRFNGIVARLGPIFVAHALEKYDKPSAAEHVLLTNRCNEAWNATAARLEPYNHKDIRVAVIYSLPYKMAQIWKKMPAGSAPHNPATNNRRLSLNDSAEGSSLWDIIATLEGTWEEFREHLEQLTHGSDELMKIAANHLLALPGFDELNLL